MYRVFLYDELPTYWPGTATVYVMNGSYADEYITDENGVPTEVKGGNAVVFHTALANFPTTGKLNRIYIDKTTNLIYRWDGVRYTEISPVNNENTVVVLNQNSTTDFTYPHGSLIVGDSIYISTRNQGGNQVIVKYPDKNDLSTFVKVVLPAASVPAGGIECLCYSSTTNKIYGPIRGGTDLFSADADDITDYTITTLSFPGGVTLFGPSAIICDNDYVYIGVEQTTQAYFIKVDAVTLTVVTSTQWVGRKTIHSGVINTNLAEGYFMTFGITADSYLARLDLAAMTYTEIALNMPNITDDIVYVELYNAVIGISESSNANNENLVYVNLNTNAVVHLDALPSYGIWLSYDSFGNTGTFISAVVAGFIETWDMATLCDAGQGSVVNQKALSKVFKTKNYKPVNEILIHGYYTDEFEYITTLFATRFGNDETGNLIEFSLSEVENTVITKSEVIERFQTTNYSIGAIVNNASAATPNNTDLVATVENEVVKKITWTNVKAFLKSYFDTLYNLYVHPNHTGEVTSTGDGATVLSKTSITGRTAVVPATGDYILLSDVSDSDNLKKALVSDIPCSGTGTFPVQFQLACSDLTTALTAATNVAYFRAPFAFTLTGVRASVLTAQSSGTILTVDINVTASSILSTKLTIDNNENTSRTAATAAVISSSSISDDVEITIDIDSAGTGGKGLIVTLIGTRTI